MKNDKLVPIIKSKGLELGFNLVGITPAKPLSAYSLYESWLQKGYAGEMAYLEKGTEKRRDPSLILKNAKSMIFCALIYYSSPPSSILPLRGRGLGGGENFGQISNYAWGRDYHYVLKEKLETIEKTIHELYPEAKTKAYVDTGPILERSYAQEAGLGWIGKNTCLINPQIGSWFFLGEILTDLELEYDQPFTTDHCGTCTRCLDACPTRAFKAPGVLDAKDCISYLTIEHRGSLPEEKRDWLGSHISGCDICQEVCPYNHDPIVTRENKFFPRDFLNQNGPGAVSLEELAKMTPEEFQKIFFESPVKRLKYEGLLRNAIIAMGNSGDKNFIRTLENMKERLHHPMLIEHIEWGLEKLSALNCDERV